VHKEVEVEWAQEENRAREKASEFEKNLKKKLKKEE